MIKIYQVSVSYYCPWHRSRRKQVARVIPGNLPFSVESIKLMATGSVSDKN